MDDAVRFEDPAVLYTNRTAEDKPNTKPADVQSDFEKYLEKSGVGKGLSLELRERTWSPDLYYLHGDHLGTATFVTNSQSQATQFFLNLPFGETMLEQMDGNYNNPFKFNAKELDDDTGLYYYGARYYNPRLSIWYGVDPLAEKFPEWSPYVYTFDNPVNYIDPDGKEGIVISGQPGGHKNREHFLANGLDRAKSALSRRKNNSEKVTWLIYNDESKKNGHSADMLRVYKERAKKLGINFKVVSSVGEINDYVNSKGTGDIKERAKDKITSLYYLGHAVPGTLNPGYPDKERGSLDPDSLNDEAFSSGTWINVVGGCRTDVDKSLIWDDSVVDKFQEKVDEKSTVNGSSTRTQYDGGVRSDEQLLKEKNGKIITVKGGK